MEVRCSVLITVTSILYLILTVSTVSGKCSGRWAIHACFGGNGKRSDPSVADNLDNRRQNSLRQILLPQSFLLDKNDLNQDSELNFDEPLRDEEQRQDINRLQLLLKTLMMEQKIRKEGSMLA
ncbi:hypothetical protein SNE40_019112 [Patella caerulea]|uniref:Uncharacterized protein n=1 Tax=Patella caerulea TaxID=87958 RepID=A0AAN8J9Y9_PATCE